MGYFFTLGKWFCARGVCDLPYYLSFILTTNLTTFMDIYITRWTRNAALKLSCTYTTQLRTSPVAPRMFFDRGTLDEMNASTELSIEISKFKPHCNALKKNTENPCFLHNPMPFSNTRM